MTMFDALVVVVNSHRQDLLGALLTDHIVINDPLDLGGLRNAAQLCRLFLFEFFGDDIVAEFDALVADIDRRASDKLLHLVLALAAERANQISPSVVLPPGHRNPPPPRSA
jgi:hypothetical protein